MVLAAGLASCLLLITQAWAVTELVLAALDDGAVGTWAAVVAAVFAGRALVGWVSDAAAARAAAVVGTDVRRRVVRAILRDGGAGRSTGEPRRARDPRGGGGRALPHRYFPALVLAGVLPFLTLVAIAILDPTSALIVLATLPLIRSSGSWSASRPGPGAVAVARDGVAVRPLPRRDARAAHAGRVPAAPRAQSRTIRSTTDRYRERTMQTLRVAFALLRSCSSWSPPSRSHWWP